LKTLTDGKNSVTAWNYDECESATKGNTLYRYDLPGNLTNVDYAVSPDLTMHEPRVPHRRSCRVTESR
jgi:hypothetical protein